MRKALEITLFVITIAALSFLGFQVMKLNENLASIEYELREIRKAAKEAGIDAQEALKKVDNIAKEQSLFENNLKKQVKNLVIPATPVLEVIKDEEVNKVSIKDDISRFKHKLVIPYFKCYWDILESTKATLGQSLSLIQVAKYKDGLEISTAFEKNNNLNVVEILLLPDGTIYYDGCSQFQAEVIMQKLLDNIKEK